MEYIIIPLTVLLGSTMTFFSGFGLSTVLLPVFCLFFPLEIAIAMTAIVHFANNVFKFGLVYKHIHVKTLLYFGIPAFLAAIAGSQFLLYIDPNTTFQFTIFKHQFNPPLLNIIIGALMIFFALLDFNKKFNNLTILPKYLPLGGLLSGFFGGLSGHQGAFRSAFLTKSGITKEAFIGTSNSISLIVDITRLIAYTSLLQTIDITHELPTLIPAVLFGFIGTFIGKKLIKKTTIKGIQKTVGILLFAMGVLIGFGII